MPRVLNATATAEASKALGTEPITIVGIRWQLDGAIIWYSDKDIIGADGKLTQVSGIDEIIKFRSGGAAGNVSISIDDTDSSIKGILDDFDIHKREAQVYQTFEYDDPDAAFANKFLIFSGVTSSPIDWDEGERVVNLQIFSKLEDAEIGFSLEEGAFPNMAKSAIGKAWPLCFGSPLRVPAVKVISQTRGTSLTRYSIISRTEADDLCNKAKTLASTERAKNEFVLDQAAAREDPIEEELDAAAYTARLTGLINAITVAYVDLLNTQELLVSESPQQEDNIAAYADLCAEISDTENARDRALLAIETTQALIIDAEQTGAELEAERALLANIIEGGNANAAQVTRHGQLVDTLIPANTALQVTLAAQLLADEANAQVQQNNLDELEADLLILKDTLTDFSLETILVDNGDQFPQGTTVRIIVQGLKLEGIFNGRLFTISGNDLPTFESLVFGAREIETPNLFWLEDSSSQIKGQYALIRANGVPAAGHYVVYITGQSGARCAYQPVIWVATDEEEGDFEFYRPAPGNGHILETSPIFRSRWNQFVGAKAHITGLDNLPDNDWSISLGNTIYLDDDFQDTYVANLIPSSEIREVLAFRTVGGEERLQPIPLNYYVKNLSDDLAGQNPTTLIFRRPLAEYLGEGWKDQIYVSLVSSEGPNTARAIEYLIENYANDLTVDAASFATVSAQVAKYPSHFPILTRKNLLATIEDIAWQARCMLSVKQEEVFIKYLPVPGSPVETIHESDIDFGSMKVGFSETLDLVTRFIAKWRAEQTQEEDFELVLRNNIPKYGDIEREFNFWIYNIESLVVKSATFWLMRYSNTWKRIRFTTPLHKLKLETLDTVELDFDEDWVSRVIVLAQVDIATLDTSSRKIEFDIWVPVRSGEMTPYVFAYPGISGAGAQYPTILDLFVGGQDHSDLVQSGASFDDTERPRDIGSKLPSDIDDVIPGDPGSGRAEENFQIPDQRRDNLAGSGITEIDIRTTRIIDSTLVRETTMDTMVAIEENAEGEQSLSLRTDANVFGISAGAVQRGVFGYGFDLNDSRWRPESAFLREDIEE